MLPRAVRQWVENRIAAVCRQVVLRGRASAGLYSCEDHATDAAEPESTIAARRTNRYGFISECPPGALVAVVRVGKGNYIGVAETVPGEPEIEDGEVLVWSTHGQRVLLNEDGDVIVIPKTGRKVLLGSDDPAEVDSVITWGDLQTELNKLINHTHSAGSLTSPSGAVTGTTGTSSALSGLTVDGSPNVFAKKP
jgi:phage gp45-like